MVDYRRKESIGNGTKYQDSSVLIADEATMQQRFVMWEDNDNRYKYYILSSREATQEETKAYHLLYGANIK